MNYEILRKEKSPSTYMDLINLASNPIVLVLHELEVRKYFADAPEMIIKFVNCDIRMQIRMRRKW
mgnify:CR=1 FL=1